jgi:hypothetical protein
MLLVAEQEINLVVQRFNSIPDLSSEDPVEMYFACITTCSLGDGDCITICTEQLRESH